MVSPELSNSEAIAATAKRERGVKGNMKFATPRAERPPGEFVLLRGAVLAMTIVWVALARGIECCAAANQTSRHGEAAPSMA
jgi:hypothetical protein